MFALTKEEKAEVIANCDNLKKIKYSRVLPKVFTEHGVIMLVNVLRSRRAIEMSIFVVRAFAKLRNITSENSELIQKITNFEK